MRAPSWFRHPLWIFLGRPLFFGIPFALFFAATNEGGFRAIHGYYAVSLVFSFFVNTAVEMNRAWVLPHLPLDPHSTIGGRPLILIISSFAVAALIASLAAAVTLHFTLVPNMLGSAQAVIRLVTYALIFTVLFLGIIYSIRFQKRLVDQVRAETERAVREAERAAREAREMRHTVEVQQALLPPRSHAGSWYAMAGASIPCRSIGGDFFEYFELPGGRIGFALADVAGKGLPAALLASMVQGIFESHARRGDGPAATLTRVNEALAAREIEARFVTMFYAVLHPSGSFAFSNAGHNPPVVLRRRDVVKRLETGGLVIGPFKGAHFDEESGALDRGDVLVLYSDGVTDAEAPDGEQYGEERFLASLSGPQEESVEAIRDRVLESVRAFAADRAPADDLTVLVVRYLGPPVANPPMS
jgi:sigma-B regulation protein RsbU (phosphoserine phosphatase)